MKTTFLSVSSLIFISANLLLTSCAGVRKMQENMANGREKEYKAFVEKSNGEIIEANEAKLRTPFFGKSTIELDQEVKIPVKEVVAYQNAYAYYRSTPGGFAPRVKKGLINMYVGSSTYTTYEAPSMSNSGFGGVRTRTRTVYYLQKGNKSPVEMLSPNVVESYVSDYAPAMDFMNDFRQTQKKATMWSIINTTAVIGGAILAGTAGLDKNDKVTAAGYGGLGMFLGGLINGFVNKVRKAKNYKNLELAIDEYNYQVTRKKK